MFQKRSEKHLKFTHTTDKTKTNKEREREREKERDLRSERRGDVYLNLLFLVAFIATT